jgi:hypothetical protein
MTNISRHSILLVLSFLLFFNCSKNQDSRLEQNIYNNLFNELLDVTITDYRALVVPSPTNQ